MRVCYGAQPRLLGTGLNPNDIDEEGRLKAERTLLEAVDEAEYLGAGGIAFLAGKWEEKQKKSRMYSLRKRRSEFVTMRQKREWQLNLKYLIIIWIRRL